MGDYIFFTDKSLNITSWGKGISSFTGIKPSEAIGKKYSRVMKRISLGNTDALSKAIKDDRTIIFKDYPMTSASGDIRADLIISTVKDRNGNIQGVRVKVSHDPSQTSTENLIGFLDLFDAGSLAHGLRGPFNAIKGASQFLRDSRPEDREIKEFVDLVDEAVNQMDKTVSKLLNLPLKKSELSDIDINLLLKKITSLSSHRLTRSKIKAFYSFGDIPYVKADSLRIQQAIMNVIDNAIEAMKEGGELRISSGMEHYNESDFVVISVSDTGPGIMQAKKQDRIKNSRGFGLTLTRLILHCHGGCMKINEEKTGTTVRLYLPVRREGK